MTLNTFCLLVVVGLVLRLTLAGQELDLVDNTEAIRPTNVTESKHWFREMVQGVRGGLGKMGSGGETGTGPFRGMVQRAGKGGSAPTWQFSVQL